MAQVAAGQHAEVDLHPGFRHDEQRRVDEGIQRACLNALNGVLDRHDALIDLAALDRREHVLDGGLRLEVAAGAEVLERGLVAESVRRAQVGHEMISR